MYALSDGKISGEPNKGKKEQEKAASMEDIVLVGFGGHAKSVIDTIERGGKYRIAGFTEVRQCEDYHGYTCLGSDDRLEAIFRSGVKNAAVCIGFMGTSDGGQECLCISG